MIDIGNNCLRKRSSKTVGLHYTKKISEKYKHKAKVVLSKETSNGER